MGESASYTSPHFVCVAVETPLYLKNEAMMEIPMPMYWSILKHVKQVFSGDAPVPARSHLCPRPPPSRPASCLCKVNKGTRYIIRKGRTNASFDRSIRVTDSGSDTVFNCWPDRTIILDV